MNDFQKDHDGDGLGEGLEAELKTCDKDTDVINFSGRIFYCSSVANLQDTDHDGLFDHWEVFGVENPQDPNKPLLFPVWGADPTHKDIFIEIDYLKGFVPLGTKPHLFMYYTTINNAPVLVEEDLGSRLSKVQDIFNTVGSAGALGNPDGKDGINLHFDVGINLTNLQYLTLYGDWGGSNEVPENTMPLPNPNPRGLNVQQMWDDIPMLSRLPSNHTTTVEEGIVSGMGNFQEIRKDKFLYIMTVQYGEDSSMEGDPDYHELRGIKFIYGHHFRTLAHEIGHYLGLKHHGSDDWGKFNCKPNYHSIMNYSFQFNDDVKFTTHIITDPINPKSIREHTGNNLQCRFSSLSGLVNDFMLNVFNLQNCSLSSFPEIDWNFNKQLDISDKPIRAQVLWNSCGQLFGDTENFFQDVLLLENKAHYSPPKLIHFKNRLYIFSGGASLTQESAPINLNFGEHGNCSIGGDSVLSTSCAPWGSVASVYDENDQKIENVRAVSAVWNSTPLWDSDSVTIAYQQNQTITTITAKQHAYTQYIKAIQPPELVTQNAVSQTPTTSAELAGIELAWVRVNPSMFAGNNFVLALFYIRNNGMLHWSTKNDPSSPWVSQGPVIFENPISGQNEVKISTFTPSIANLPHFGYLTEGHTCGIFSKNNDGTNLIGTELWCLSQGSDLKWLRVDNAVANTIRKPSLVFHTPRYFDGEEIDKNKGYFIATSSNFEKKGSTRIKTFARVSESISINSLLHQNINIFQHGPVSYYDKRKNDSNVLAVLYEDNLVSSTKGIVLTQSKDSSFSSPASIRFLPLADGTYDLVTNTSSGGVLHGIRAGNDHHIMEEKMCWNLHRTKGWPCGRCANTESCPSGLVCKTASYCNNDPNCTPTHRCIQPTSPNPN